MTMIPNNLTTFEHIKLFVNQAFDQNSQFTTKSLQAYIRTCTHNTIRNYLAKLQIAGFIEQISQGIYTTKASIPANYNTKSLTRAYSAYEPKPRKAPNIGVFDNLKAYLIELPDKKPLDEIFDLSEIRAAINPENINSVNLKISNYLSMLKRLGYISKSAVKQYQLLKPIPDNFSSFTLQYEYDKANSL